jgi:hypothetical protein
MIKTSVYAEAGEATTLNHDENHLFNFREIPFPEKTFHANINYT